MFEVPRKEDVDRVSRELAGPLSTRIRAVYNGPAGCDGVREFVQGMIDQAAAHEGSEEDAAGKLLEIVFSAGVVAGMALAEKEVPQA